MDRIVTPTQFSEIRTSLLDQGYSRAYVARLVDELQDHLASGVDDVDPPIGAPEAILGSVREHAVLLPLPQRFPCLAFVVVPGLLSCLATLLAIHFAEALTGSVPAASFEGRILLADGLVLFSGFVSAFIPIAAIWTARRYKLPWPFPLMSVLLVTIIGLFRVQVVAFPVSHDILCGSSWGVSGWRTLGPLLIFAVDLVPKAGYQVPANVLPKILKYCLV